MSHPVANRRTFGRGRWSAAELAERKRRQGLRVSVVLPARDEEKTIGSIVERLVSDLVDAVPLIDELVVVDSDSTDATYAVAAAAGARVHRASEIAPELGSRPGKGEAMWKSLFVTEGDILVFMDADLVEWETDFVVNLVGPFLEDRGIDLVKGFYERPLILGDGSALAAGRVTELVARPVIALQWPELSGLVQPLAGEWAIRRSWFAELSVPTGYAVELAALVDTAAAHGAAAIAQVDLGRREHGHQGLHDLGVMATQILAMARDRAGRATERPETVHLRQFAIRDEEPVALDRFVPVDERPPAVSVAGYRSRETAEHPC
ncbi:glucosyl-3-phosphoglycerate synthase [Mumia zhuanghuii]|uniref:Glucosyl-3-phosphoglycerate synthase n=2 Tax=Mumia TaxID=1546255 RepID=A0ABW1QHZ1_9ACTN|nr:MULTISPECIES: glucosyl-3-phosphoglycerate synthase [Mumia]KAA1418311.1 glucosyl-3-phosphoglycerate synthase [Mumia zhuanghuii]